MIYFQESVSAVNNWISCLLNEDASVGGRASCVSCGIIRGGGVGFAPTTFGIHTLKAMEKMFRYVAEVIDTRVLPSTIFPTFDAPLLTNAGCKNIKGSPRHLDNKGGDWIQAEYIFWTPA